MLEIDGGNSQIFFDAFREHKLGSGFDANTGVYVDMVKSGKFELDHITPNDVQPYNLTNALIRQL